MIAYLIKSLIYSAVFTGYYWFMLRDKKMHHFNRFYLLTTIVASLVLPLYSFNLFMNEEATPLNNRSYLRAIRSIVPLKDKPIESVISPFLIVSGIITILLLILFITKLLDIYHIKRHNHIIKQKGYNFIETRIENAPFTFLNNLFWRTDISLKEETGLKIFKHELAHIRGKHSLDRLFCQSIVSIFWMNPFFWLMQKEVLLIHEYIADSESVDEGDTDSFARILLKSVDSPKLFYPAHFFFTSPIKRRLAMITKLKKPGYSLMSKVLVIPVTILIVSLMLLISGNAQNSDDCSMPPSFRSLSQANLDTIYDSLDLDVKYIKSDGSTGTVNQNVKYIKSSDKSKDNDLRKKTSQAVIYDSVDVGINYINGNGSKGTLKNNVKYITTTDKRNSPNQKN